MKSKILKIKKMVKTCLMHSHINKAAQNVQKSVLKVSACAHFIVPSMNLYHDGHLIAQSPYGNSRVEYENFSKNKSKT